VIVAGRRSVRTKDITISSMSPVGPFCDVNGPIDDDGFKPSCGHVLEYFGVALWTGAKVILGGSHLTPPPASTVGRYRYLDSPCS
jgi:hypothetical protein